MFVSEEAEVSYQRMEENLKQENALCHQKIEELGTAKRCELAARDTKHSREIAECKHWFSHHVSGMQIFINFVTFLDSCYSTEMTFVVI
jgi:hypothetical protein